MSFAEKIYILISLLGIGLVAVVLSSTGVSGMSAGLIRFNTGDINQGSRQRNLGLFAFGLVWMLASLAFAFYLSSPINLGSSQAAPSPGPSSSASTADAEPVMVVKEYFAAINGHDYGKAWAVGGKYSGAASRRDFEAEFRGTAHDDVVILSLSGNVVKATLIAQQTDGSVKTFQGYYTVKNGAITHFNVWQSG